jgi:hypothetical protein
MLIMQSERCQLLTHPLYAFVIGAYVDGFDSSFTTKSEPPKTSLTVFSRPLLQITLPRKFHQLRCIEPEFPKKEESIVREGVWIAVRGYVFHFQSPLNILNI